jgi:dolichol-phosphate mannosyltransferase
MLDTIQPELIGTSTRSVRPRTGIIRVVLPAYNEQKSLPALLERLDLAFEESSLLGDILIVNDGSTDETVRVVRNYAGQSPVRLLDLQPNRGLAEALKNGLLTAVAECEAGDIIITMDADNTHTPGLNPRR